ncbi:glucose-6-phosphate exchanger SLC37A2 isoform X2 [Hylaeus anthracinus]|uniref:glucose-6-phosphate exchanger SLC37A2 isoform X2 n=1 Tax=Hylaeus volcanicus TaxID=313075 RepID=UPI0023B878F6|nr:glucose-6-phosphate exchanger SLC37A2 isoform X2 [Hylaeus volcanicus]XP_054001520.1 glucose-6-phosphate exchanger SLC37A2 isoform X2 [Hylaeus anthracinus]
MTNILRDEPWGLQVLECAIFKCCPHGRVNRIAWHQGGVLALTYLAYTCYHMTRKPISVVKNVLSLNCSSLSPPDNIVINSTNRDTWCDWAPFDTAEAPALLGMLDSAFLFAYAAAMFLSGFIAERVNLRYFLTFGMLASGISCYLFGIAKPYNIHSLWYFVLVQAAGGIFQTSGWPGVVTVVGNWFGKGKRGLIFGIWNSHTSLGNILGTLLAAEFVESDWGLSFMVPGATMGLTGFMIFLFLAPNPMDIGCIPSIPPRYRKFDANNTSDEDNDVDDYENCNNDIEDDVACLRSETSPILGRHRRVQEHHTGNAIGFIGAMGIPGVIEYSLSLFFAKLVSYTFLYWLPLYIAASTTYSATLSADVSILFDVGGIAGAIAAGILSDYNGMSALTCALMLGFAVPALFLYDYIGSSGLGINIMLLLISGLLVNGPYALITTVVSAELGTHPSLGNSSRALATVTAIIDGTGSIGAAIGPLLAGLVSRWAGWHNVFYMLMIADMLALLFLSRLVYRDIQVYRQRWRVV